MSVNCAGSVGRLDWRRTRNGPCAPRECVYNETMVGLPGIEVDVHNDRGGAIWFGTLGLWDMGAINHEWTYKS